MKKYFISCDLEGVHGIVGEPYSGLLKTIADYPKAVENLTLEVNTAIRALFDGGADEVHVWDGHGGGGNLDFSFIDSRAEQIHHKTVYSPQRLDCLKDGDYSGVILIGYHAREGTGGVLAHTYSSVHVQYMKINGVPYGEFEFDSSIIGGMGIPTIFMSSDDVALKQMQAFAPHIITVVTKYAKGRNKALFRDCEEVLQDIYDGVRRAMDIQEIVPPFTYPCEFEVRYTRMEYAEEILTNRQDKLPSLCYGDDLHILKATLRNVNDLRLFF